MVGSAPFTRSSNPLIRGLFYIWASPSSILGIAIGCLGMLTGGHCQRKRGCLEFYGGFVTWALKRIPNGGGVAAMTLGHTIIGQTAEGLKIARDHEQVHVRQYERWGPIFIPAYVSCSIYLWLQKKECYFGNPFEVEAYRVSDPRIVRRELARESES